MDDRSASPVGEYEAGTGSLASYVTGFVFSLFLTLDAYMLVVKHVLQGSSIIAVIIGLAAVQLVVQLRFFLHLGRESQPRWNLWVFALMAIVLLILVLGSLWIMNNLNYRMTPQEMLQYINNQGGGF